VLALGLCQQHYEMRRAAEQRATQEAIDKNALAIGKNGRSKGGPGAGLGVHNGGGGPTKLTYDEPTLKRIRDLAGLQCTLPEIAGVLQCCDDTLRKFLDDHEEARRAFREGKENGKASLRRIQFVQAKRSAAMGIWLGKNWLGQTDSYRIGPLNGQPGSAADDLGCLESATALLRAVRSESE